MENIINISVAQISNKITKEIVKEFISDIESKLSATLLLWGYKNLNHYADCKTDDPKQKTVEKTKLISCFYEISFKNICKKHGLDILDKSADGFDIVIDNIEYEMKLNLSSSDTWTGNSYSQVKVKNLILIKLDINDDNKVSKAFFSILKSQNSDWKSSKNGKNNNAFSSLSISKNDSDNLDTRLTDLANRLGETILIRHYKGVDYEVKLDKKGLLHFNGEVFDTPNKLYNNGIVKFVSGKRGNSGTNHLSQFTIKETGERLQG